MISIFAPDETDFTKNGLAVLDPISAVVRQVAGGEYSFTMEHPLDPVGKWQHLIREYIVKLPVPRETIPAATVGYDVDVYVTNTTAALRDGPSEPSSVTYPAWDINTNYQVGAKVSNSGKNWQCTYFDETSAWAHIAPPSCSWWKEIPTSSGGAAVIATIQSGTDMYVLDDVDTSWYQVSTTYGLVGYMKKSQLTYSRHITPQDLEPRVINEQLFRIKEVQVDRNRGIVNVSGNHVSLDLNAILVENVELTNVTPAMAIGKMTEAFMMSYRGTIATNMSTDDDGTYTGTIKRKNAMFCLTDPDSGIVPQFDARFTRDNWDLFIMTRVGIGNEFQIKYGQNVNGIIWKVNSSRLVTRIVPVAKAENGDDLYLPEKWVDSEYIDNYPVIYMEPLNVKGQVGKETETGSGTVWTEEDLLDEMRAKARERFDNEKIDIPVTDVTVQLERPEYSAEWPYPWMRNLQSIVLYDYVTVKDPDIGLNIRLAASEIEYNCIERRITGIKFSNNMKSNTTSVAGYNLLNGTLTENKFAGGVRDGIVNEAVDTVLSMIE